MSFGTTTTAATRSSKPTSATVVIPEITPCSTPGSLARAVRSGCLCERRGVSDLVSMVRSLYCAGGSCKFWINTVRMGYGLARATVSAALITVGTGTNLLQFEFRIFQEGLCLSQITV